jgi:hypothetical protein
MTPTLPSVIFLAFAASPGLEVGVGEGEGGVTVRV